MTTNTAEINDINFLVYALKNYKVLIDTSSLLSEYADKFWENIIPLLQQENKIIIIPYSVYLEVDKFASNPDLCAKKHSDNPNLNQLAINAKSRIASLHQSKLIQLAGDTNNVFADSVIISIFAEYRTKANMILITQDHNLAVDIIHTGQCKSVKTVKKILVERIGQYGSLEPFFPAQKPADLDLSTESTHKTRAFETGNIPENEKFAVAKSIAVVTEKQHSAYQPEESDTVFIKRNGHTTTMKLIQVIKSGGEGTIYTTDMPNVVAKIYKSKNISSMKYEKLKLMVSKRLDYQGICFPIDILYDAGDEFVGCSMPKAEGKEMSSCVFLPPLLKQYFPNWNKEDTVTLCITILKMFKFLHERNIIVGDIKPDNIFVVSPTRVYFVDADSYQIEGFPCPVGSVNFTAPEIQGKRYENFLRSMGNEMFAVATLLFMIMLPGKAPYSLLGGENQIENIMNGDFAYAFGDRSNGRTPKGVWRYCWSHLPFYLKRDFYETFAKHGEHHAEETRFSTNEWLKRFVCYLSLIKNGYLAKNDPSSLELLPTTLKKSKYTVESNV